MKANQIPWYYFGAVILFIAWLFWLYMDETMMEVRTPLFWGGLFGLIILVLVNTLILAQAKSPKITYTGGHDIWDPEKPWLLESPKDSKENKLTFDFRSVPGGGYKALNFYAKGGGRKGVHIWADIPGAWEYQYPNLVLRFKSRIVYRGYYQHRKLGFIYKRIKEEMAGKGLRLEDEDPIFIYLIPSPEVNCPVEVLDHLSKTHDALEFWGSKVSDREDEIAAQHAKTRDKYMMDYGPDYWKGEGKSSKGGQGDEGGE
jgi:hypothetical protein